MSMSSHEQKHLVRALRQYSNGHPVAGDYQLWVGFGDHWTAFKTRLIRNGYLAKSPNGALELTERGSAFFERIRPAAA